MACGLSPLPFNSFVYKLCYKYSVSQESAVRPGKFYSKQIIYVSSSPPVEATQQQPPIWSFLNYITFNKTKNYLPSHGCSLTGLLPPIRWYNANYQYVDSNNYFGSRITAGPRDASSDVSDSLIIQQGFCRTSENAWSQISWGPLCNKVNGLLLCSAVPTWQYP